MTWGWLYPKVRNFRRIIPYVFLGGILGGCYGVIHDQLSYTISSEYFTAFKFYQFQYVDFGLPNRVFASIIGFIATWWVGLFVGWILARIRYYSGDFKTANRDILEGFATVAATALLALCIGALIGYIRAFCFPLNEFWGWEKELSGLKLQKFVMVGIIHNSEYLGGLIGLVVAVTLLKQKMKKHNRV